MGVIILTAILQKGYPHFMPASDQGPLNGRYKLVPRALIFLTRGESVLLIKGAASKRLWAGLFNGIGGHIERGEDVLGAAQRELLEETGLSAPNLWLCGVIIIDTGEEVGIAVYVLRGESSEGDLRPSREGELEWVPRSQIEALPLVEDLPILLPRVLEMQPGEPPFAALYSFGESGQLKIAFASQEIDDENTDDYGIRNAKYEVRNTFNEKDEPWQT